MSFHRWTLEKTHTKVLPKKRTAGESGGQWPWSHRPSHLFIKGIRQATICWWSHCLDEDSMGVVIPNTLALKSTALRCLALDKVVTAAYFSKSCTDPGAREGRKDSFKSFIFLLAVKDRLDPIKWGRVQLLVTEMQTTKWLLKENKTKTKTSHGSICHS